MPNDILILSYIGLIQSIFAIVLILSKKFRQVPDKILFAWLMVIALQIAAPLIVSRFQIFPPHGMLFLFSFQFAFGPFLYLYTQLYLSNKPSFRPGFFLHFLPVPISILVILANISSFPAMPPPEVSADIPNPPRFVMFVGICVIISILIYAAMALKLLKNYKTDLSHLSRKNGNNAVFDRLSWLKTIAVVFSCTYIGISFVLVYNDIMQKNSLNPGMIQLIGLTLFLFSISYFGFKKPTVFNDEGSSDEPDDSNGTHKYRRSGLKEPDAEYYLESLTDYMEYEKPYLKSDLTIQDLSNELKIPRHYLTQVINERLGKNFSTYVTEFRIKEFKRKLDDPGNSRFTILSLAFESGFNSKAGFYSAFKKIEHITPTQYRKNIQK